MYLFIQDPATTEIYTLSLHDALPIFPHDCRVRHRQPALSHPSAMDGDSGQASFAPPPANRSIRNLDRKSTRLNSSHVKISYAVFCLKKKTRRTITLCSS